MNFSNHYFREEQVNEKLSDIISKGPTGAIKAVTQRAGQGALNVLRGATGRMKTAVFEPGWLKVLRPTNQANYKKSIDIYSNWKNKKTKLGPKQNFSVVDVKNGKLGTYSKDDFIDLLGRYDAKVKSTEINMDANIPPRITVYMLSNKGKVIFFDLPVGEDGKKRYYAMGLDNKAERAFTLIHGMRFEDFIMDPSEEADTGDKEEPKTAAKRGTLKFKYEVPPDQYKKLIPKAPIKLAASYEYPSLLDIFEEDVLHEKALEVDGKKAVMTKNGEWYRLTAKGKKPYNTPISTFKDNLIAVNSKGEPDEALQGELDKEIAKYKEAEGDRGTEDKKDTTVGNEEGSLYADLKDEIDINNPPSKVKPSQITKNGWRFMLKNGGIVFIYQTTDDKNMIGFDDKAKKVVDAKDLINKYKLKISKETPETESPE